MSDIKAEDNRLIQVYLKYRERIYHQAYRVVSDNKAAEDIVYRVFESLAESGILNERDGNEEKIKFYLMMITGNESCKAMREGIEVCSGIEDPLPKDCDNNGMKDEDKLLSRMTLEEMVSCVRTIPRRYANLLILKYADNNDDKQIAKLFHMKEENVRRELKAGESMIVENYLKIVQKKEQVD